MTEIEQAFLETNYIIKFESNIILKIGKFHTQLINNFPEIKTWAFITA